MDNDKGGKRNLRVIGWTDMDNRDFPFAENLSDEAFDAIVREVREKGYLFGGDAHQDRSGCCPVLSDGTKAYFSWRGWGYLIAVAYDCRTADGGYDHLCGYMDSLIKPKARKYPKDEVDYSLLEGGAEHNFVLPEGQEYFSYKRLDFRPATEEALSVQPFDLLTLDFTVWGIAEGESEARRHQVESKFRVLRVFRGENFEDVFEKLREEYPYADMNVCGYDVRSDENAENYRKKTKLCGTEIEVYEYPDEVVFDKLYADYGRENVEKHGALCYVLGAIKEGE